MVLAVTYPWSSASSYLSSQSVADSRCNPHATPRFSYSRRSPSCRFFLCRPALLCLILGMTHIFFGARRRFFGRSPLCLASFALARLQNHASPRRECG